MNYIRTKTGHIYKHELGFDRYNYSTGDVYYRVENKKGFYNEFSREKDIVSWADTIEELCDEFVFIDVGIRQDKKYIFQSLKEAKSKAFLYDKCYGAIWTDKGLIYVAKMNSKGELELL